MQKVKLTADVLLNILQGVLSDNDIDKIIDPNAPDEWQGESIQELLNIKYYTFKHRPESTEQINREILIQKRIYGEPVEIDEIAALNRAFGCFTLSTVDRDFSKTTDTSVCSGILDFWLQTNKIKLLEYLIERCNVVLSRVLIPVSFNMSDGSVEKRAVTIVFEKPDTSGIDLESPIGEAVKISVKVDIGLSLETVRMVDYTFEFSVVTGAEGMPVDFVEVPIRDFSFTGDMVNKGIPWMKNPKNTRVINLSGSKIFSFMFDGISGNSFIEWLRVFSLFNGSTDNNQPVYLRITQGGNSCVYETVITQHTCKAIDDGSGEAHSLNLSVIGVIDGTKQD